MIEPREQRTLPELNQTRQDEEGIAGPPRRRFHSSPFPLPSSKALHSSKHLVKTSVPSSTSTDTRTPIPKPSSSSHCPDRRRLGTTAASEPKRRDGRRNALTRNVRTVRPSTERRPRLELGGRETTAVPCSRR